MQIVTVGDQHINVNAITRFYHDGFNLVIFMFFMEKPFYIPDKDREKYRTLCNCDYIGVNMVEAENDTK